MKKTEEDEEKVKKEVVFDEDVEMKNPRVHLNNFI